MWLVFIGNWRANAIQISVDARELRQNFNAWRSSSTQHGYMCNGNLFILSLRSRVFDKFLKLWNYELKFYRLCKKSIRIPWFCEKLSNECENGVRRVISSERILLIIRLLKSQISNRAEWKSIFWLFLAIKKVEQLSQVSAE